MSNSDSGLGAWPTSGVDVQCVLRDLYCVLLATAAPRCCIIRSSGQLLLLTGVWGKLTICVCVYVCVCVCDWPSAGI